MKLVTRVRYDFIKIMVLDTGTGIEESKLDHIFEAFSKIMLNRELNQEGVGLGLTISRTLARAMEGDLTVKSRLGYGSKFTITLPYIARKPTEKFSTSPSHESSL